jgi:uncharacterized Ntn-hydrolase superfamily protein
MRRTAPLVAALVLAGVPASAHATWSIVAVDPDTQQVGVAVASCVEAPFGTTLLPQVPGVVPGVGALAAQAYLDQGLRDYAVEQLAAGLSASEVIDAVNAIDDGDAVRQYGVVTLAGDTASFTGRNCQEWAGSVEATNVSAQGNILYGPEVADDALAAFLAEAPACPFTLADRLMLALEAGAAQGGDNRCSMEQSALAAVIIVANPDDDIDAPMLDLRIPSQDQGGDNPVALLRAEYDAWRLEHPPDDSRCGGDTTGSADDTTSTTATEDTTSTTGADSTSAASSVSTSTSADDAPTTTSDDSSSSVGASEPDTANGCGCTSSPPRSPAWFLVLLARRRRQRLCTTL